MIPLDDAVEIVLSTAWRLPSERVALTDAHGRVLSEAVASDVASPPFNKASMDGYACRAEDAFEVLTVVGVVAAGQTPERGIEPGECMKVMTGAPVPEGADAILIVEEVEAREDTTVRFTGKEARSHITARGHDVMPGDVILNAGARIGPSHLASLANAGCVEPLVSRRPRVGVLATGDELVAPETVPGAGKIRNSNSVQLTAQARRAGAEATDLGIVPDDPDALAAAIRSAAESHDVVLTTGGVSMGDYDHVPGVLEGLGVTLRFQRVAIQPGKPVAFGVLDERAYFGLSGNPYSSLVQFELLARPLLDALQGAPASGRTIPIALAEAITRRNAKRRFFRPVTITADGKARAVEYHGSAHIQSLMEADGLVIVPEGVEGIAAGDHADVRLLG